MVSKISLGKLKKAMEASEEERERCISLSRKLTKKSKEAIYLVHRGELRKAVKILIDVRKQLKKLPNHGFSPAYEEYAEAKLFSYFVQKKRVLSFDQLNVGAENYIGGLSDLTGELARRAVLLGIKKEKKEIEIIRDAVDSIHGELLKIHFRNGELRRKYDSIKWNLEKIEKILYDVRT